MLTDYQDKIVARRRLRTALIPAALTAAVGVVLIGGLMYGVAQAQDASPIATTPQASTVASDLELAATPHPGCAVKYAN